MALKNVAMEESGAVEMTLHDSAAQARSAGNQIEQVERVDSHDAPSEPDRGLVEEMGPFQAYMRIFQYGSRTDKVLQGIAVVAAIASGVGLSMQTLIFGNFITTMNDFSTGKADGDEFRKGASELALYFLYLGIGRFVVSYTYNLLFTYAAHRVTRNIRYEFFRAALRQEVAFYDAGSAGSIATQATSNGRLIQGGISEKLGLAIQATAGFFASFVVSFVVQWKLSLICICVAPAALIVLGTVSAMQVRIMIQSIGVYMRASSFVEGVLGGVRLVHAFEMRERLARKLGDQLAEAQKIGNKLSPLNGTMFASQYTISHLGYGLAFWQGIRMLARGEITDSGVIFTVIMSIILAATNLTMLTPNLVDFSQAASAAAKLYAVIDRVSAIDPFGETGEMPNEVEGELDVENITFAYPTRPNVTVLDDFSLKIPAGKVTAFVGASGSGKSTIVGLIERWYNPHSGCIKLDGRPIYRYNLNWLRTSIRLVQQEPVLFAGTVLDNIRHGLHGTKWEHMSEEEQLAKIQDAAKIAFAHDFIIGLPNGYDTDIGQRGGLLSGGQKQRIAIARSIVSDPKILLLDEATSALDPHAEEIVQRALERASKGRTTIVIAHKLATIRKADNIVVMNKGKIVEQGTHETLMARDDAYARLVRAQDITASPDGDEPTETEDEFSECSEETRLGPGNRRISVPRPHSIHHRGEIERQRYDYDLHKQLGIPVVIYRLFADNKELAWVYVVALLGVIGAAASYPAQAILISKVVTVFTLTGPELTERGDFFASMFVVLAAGSFVIYFSLGYTTNIIAQSLNCNYRKQLFLHVLRQDVQFFERTENAIGALTGRVDSIPQSIQDLMGANIAMIAIAFLNLTASSVLALAHSWKLGLVVILAGLPPLVGVGMLKIRLDAKLDRETSKRYSTSASIASDAVTAIRTVSSLAIEKTMLGHYKKELDYAVNDSKVPLCKVMVWFALMQAMDHWFMALGFWYGCRLLSFGEVDTSAFLIAFLGVFFAGQASSAMFQYSTSITKGLNSANYIFWLQSRQPAIQAAPGDEMRGPDNAERVSLENVQFAYLSRLESPVLKGVSIAARQGQFIALVGASGCGKSTIISLLERYYDVSAGNINIDGLPLTSLNPRLYRRALALVPQEPTLFDGTIRENIALGIDEPSHDSSLSEKTTNYVPDSAIEIALRSANAWDFVSSLPDGLSTQVGNTGSQFSGGQRQRLAIARALIRNPKVLLLDEATSALDTESEKIVQNALDEASRDSNRITFAVAHRLSTIRHADLICVFHAGRIVESGTHNSLVAQGGMYKKMCEAQAIA
ncbi:ABC multidrug transporter atrC [Paramyrothecium foliicola]|nr:ABC multidrug transporter atrC [Paramyrothecium foliicola]